jgi:hypothetical protein
MRIRKRSTVVAAVTVAAALGAAAMTASSGAPPTGHPGDDSGGPTGNPTGHARGLSADGVAYEIRSFRTEQEVCFELRSPEPRGAACWATRNQGQSMGIARMASDSEEVVFAVLPAAADRIKVRRSEDGYEIVGKALTLADGSRLAHVALPTLDSSRSFSAVEGPEPPAPIEIVAFGPGGHSLEAVTVDPE